MPSSAVQAQGRFNNNIDVFFFSFSTRKYRNKSLIKLNRKSSIIRLLYRFFEPDSGEILINGQNIKDVELESLRKNIAIVPQDSVLFHDSIYYNLHYGNLNKTREEVFKASSLADLHSTVLQWPKGYDTPVSYHILNNLKFRLIFLKCRFGKHYYYNNNKRLMFLTLRWEKGD